MDVLLVLLSSIVYFLPFSIHSLLVFCCRLFPRKEEERVEKVEREEDRNPRERKEKSRRRREVESKEILLGIPACFVVVYSLKNVPQLLIPEAGNLASETVVYFPSLKERNEESFLLLEFNCGVK